MIRIMTDRPHLSDLYDAVPYVDYPYSFAHPRRLEASAAMFGMEPPPISACRVLELGCAGGGNLIPQAQDLPESTFAGVDLSAREIDAGRQTIGELRLQNIELAHADIMDIDADWGKFDYVLCHGVMSWVPPEVQEKIFAVCARNMAPNGVAFVSYNTYPGWHLSNVARDLMLYHASRFEDPGQQISQAKQLLKFAVEVSDGDGAGESG